MSRIITQTIERVALARLREHPLNPRRGNMEAVKESIDNNGFFGTIVANKRTGYILAGNHRARAALAAGLDAVDVAWVDVDEDAEQRILLADNRTSDLGDYDNEALATLLDGLAQSQAGLVGTGYDQAALDALLEGLTPPTDEDLEDAFGALPDGDKSDFEAMSFTLHREQADAVRQAIDKAKAQGPFVGTGNDNSNGNALARFAEAYLGRG